MRTLAQDRKELGDGRFTFINIQVVTSTGTVMLYATFPNDNEALRSTRSTLMFAVSSSRHKNALLARERFRMAATEQGRRHDHQNDG